MNGGDIRYDLAGHADRDLPAGILTQLDRLAALLDVDYPDWTITVQLGPTITLTAMPASDTEDEDG